MGLPNAILFNTLSLVNTEPSRWHKAKTRHSGKRFLFIRNLELLVVDQMSGQARQDGSIGNSNIPYYLFRY
jgi:hypothetical protein